MTEQTFIIVGAGQAAVQAATTLRGAGFSGAITILGDEPHLPYQRPPLSKKFLTGEVERERITLKPQSFFDQNQIDIRLRVRAIAINPGAHTVEVSDGTRLQYDKLLLATGARVRRVNVPGSHAKNICYLRNIADVETIVSTLSPGCRLGLVGGGYIGLEVAAAAVTLGCLVQVFEMADRVMNRVVSAPVSAFFETEHCKAGVTLMLRAAVAAFEEEGGLLRAVRLTDGRRFPVDAAIIGVGVEPESSLAREAGIACDNGIVVDEYGATSAADVFAAGDCTYHPNPFVGGPIRLESVQNAIDQSKHAAFSMLGEKMPYGEVPWFWSDQYDHKLQIAGIHATGDDMIIRGDPTSRSFAIFHLRGENSSRHIVAVESVNAVAEYMIGRKLIAARTAVSADRLVDVSQAMKSFLSS